MQLNSMKIIYNAVNAVATGKLDPETEERVSKAIKAELLAIAAHLPAKALSELPAQSRQHIEWR
jgi:hypothetical protein